MWKYFASQKKVKYLSKSAYKLTMCVVKNKQKAKRIKYVNTCMHVYTNVTRRTILQIASEKRLWKP